MNDVRRRRSGRARRLTSALSPLVWPVGPINAQVFRASARHRKGDLTPTGCGEVLSTLLVILAVWLIGVPLATVALTALLMWREREPGVQPRSRNRNRIRTAAGGRRCDRR